jgi:hypothetical protein
MEAGELYFSTEQRLQWHPVLHEKLGHETLHYWFLSFSSSYEWDLVRAELLALLGRLHVYSFALYELMGDCDVLLRVWLPRGTSSSFRVELQKCLAGYGLSEDKLFSVEEVLRHWPFAADGKGEISVIDENGTMPGPETIAKANDKLLDQVSVEDEVLGRLVEDGLLGPRDHRPDQVAGVKIVTLLKPKGDLETSQIHSLAKEIAAVLDGQESIRQRSLYQVEGRAVFLLTCLVPEGHFFAFRDDLVSLISPLCAAAGIRTNSYACASPKLLMFQDLIPSPGARRAPARLRSRNIADLLRLEESTTLEVKGSAFTPLDKWLFDGEDRKESDSFFHKSVIKTVGAFLNSEGGSIVIGALETNRYREREEEMVATAPRFTEIGAYLSAGILDPFYVERGWDRYERRIEEKIAASIEPDPSPLLSIRNEEVEGNILCVIEVVSGRDAGWHYLKDRRGSGLTFIVRQGSRTVELDGVDADRYKERYRDPPR